MRAQGTSVPVAIPSAARRKLAQAGVLPDVGVRAATFVPPHQLLAAEDDGGKFSLQISTGVRVPPLRASGPAGRLISSSFRRS